MAKQIPTKNRVEKLDELARSLAEPLPRRRALRLLVGGLFGLAVTSGHPKRALAGGENVNPDRRYQLKNTPCIDDMCSRGKICGVSSLPNKWGQTGCIKLGCCQGDEFCCAGPATEHGAVGGCCPKGFNCNNGKCVCNGKISFNKGSASASASFTFAGLQGQRCICPDERVCGSGCCKEGEQHMQCDCKSLKALQIELRNAIRLQQAFRNQIAELRGKGKDSSQSAFENFAKGEARRGLESIPGYKGPLYVEYYPWGRGLSEDADRSRYKPAELCRMIDSSARDLTDAKEKSACAGIGAALQAHEDWHINFCTTIGFKRYEEMHGADRAQEEVEAYGEQIKVLRDILSHLGCG